MRAVILGAGPTGLAAAEEILRARRDIEVIIIEARSRPGGLASSHPIGAHQADLGPHRLHEEASREVRSMFGANAPLAERTRRGRLHIRGRSVDYPLHPLATLEALGFGRALLYAASALHARAGARRSSSFAGETRRRVGQALFRDLYEPSARKVWGRSPNALDADQARARVGASGPRELFLRLFGRDEPGKYLYPKAGANGLAYEAWSAALARRGARFQYGTEVTSVLHCDAHVAGVTVRRGSEHTTWSADRVVSTLALPRLLERLSPDLAGCLEDARALRLRTVVLLYVVLARPRLTDRDVHYFPSEEVPFARMTEQSAFGRIAGAPENETVLSFDFYDDPEGALTRAPAEELLERAWPTLRSFGVSEGDVRAMERVIAPDAYPVLHSGYKGARDRALDALATIEGLLTAGRGGLFLHINQHHAIEIGFAAGRTALAPSGGGRRWRAEARRFEAFRVVD